eukprot:jgi/Ulvmu1/9777/UM056_0017.1
MRRLGQQLQPSQTYSTRLYMQLRTRSTLRLIHQVCTRAASATSCPDRAVMKAELALDDVESQVFDTLLAAREHHNLQTTLRCAGGWVRDKLLGRDSKDIDIALDDISGKEFAEKVQEYQTAQGCEASGMGVIPANPDQSKHLETATLRLHGLSIDMVHLRSETYTEHSRIPTIEVGTPIQDAERRDFTINTLFYNLNTGEVEDYTGRGLQDMKEGIIRTPLEPKVTFMDDPLRVLRAVRFASRYRFTMVDDLKAAAASEEVKVALDRKIARERIGVEMAGCFDGPRPLLSVEYLLELGIFSIVFEAPQKTLDVIGREYSEPCLRCLRLATPILMAHTELWNKRRRVANAAAMLLPLRLHTCATSKKCKVPLAKEILTTSVKWPNKDADHVALIHRMLPELCRIHDAVNGLPEGEHLSVEATFDLRADLGTCLAQLKDLSELALAIFPLLYHDDAMHYGDVSAAIESSGQYEAPHRAHNEQELLAYTERMNKIIADWDLEGCHSWAPLINGKQIVSLLGLSKPGPLVGKMTALARKWQYAHVERHSKSEKGPVPPELEDYLQGEHAKLNS